MQPTFTSFSDPYTPQFYHPQNPNPNPYPLHQPHQYPHAVDPYFQSYSISHPGGPYTYAAEHNWPPEESVQQYGNNLYDIGGTIHQDISQHILPVIPTQTTWTNQIPTVKPRGPWKKIPKKPKIVQSAWCEICKIECNSKDILDKHKLGKKHIKNVEKLNPAAASVATSNPIIGPSENPKKGNLGIKKKAEAEPDLETKRRKVVAGGADENAVRLCGICNVVCNSDAVFRFHLAGQKHASMWKKLQEAGGV